MDSQESQLSYLWFLKFYWYMYLYHGFKTYVCCIWFSYFQSVPAKFELSHPQALELTLWWLTMLHQHDRFSSLKRGWHSCDFHLQPVKSKSIHFLTVLICKLWYFTFSKIKIISKSNFQNWKTTRSEGLSTICASSEAASFWPGTGIMLKPRSMIQNFWTSG